MHVRWERAQEIHGLKRMEIGNTSDTRWACQAKQLSAMAKRIEVVHEVLEKSLTVTLMPIVLSMQMDLNYRWIAVLCGISLLPGIF